MRKLTLAAALALFSTAAVAAPGADSAKDPAADQGPRASGELALGADAGPLGLRAGARAQAVRPAIAMKDPTTVQAAVRAQAAQAQRSAEDGEARKGPRIQGLDGKRRVRQR